jgi:hypothetical protein
VPNGKGFCCLGFQEIYAFVTTRGRRCDCFPAAGPQLFSPFCFKCLPFDDRCVFTFSVSFPEFVFQLRVLKAVLQEFATLGRRLNFCRCFALQIRTLLFL